MVLCLVVALFGAGATMAPGQIVRDDETATIKNAQPTTIDQPNAAWLPKTSLLPLTALQESASSHLFGKMRGAKIGGNFKTPVTETGVVGKSAAVKDLRDWFTTFFSQEKVGAPVEAVAGGFSGLVFDAEISGITRRGIAVDYGDFVMYHLTTDKTATTEEVGQAAFNRMEMVARAATDLDPNNKDRCNCVFYVRNNFVPSLPPLLSTSTQKQNIINHYFPRVPSAAIHPIYSGAYSANWHVSAVRNITIQSNGSLNLTIREAHYPICGIYERSGTPDQLGIMGYYDPTYPVTSGSRSDTNHKLVSPARERF